VEALLARLDSVERQLDSVTAELAEVRAQQAQQVQHPQHAQRAQQPVHKQEQPLGARW